MGGIEGEQGSDPIRTGWVTGTRSSFFKGFRLLSLTKGTNGRLPEFWGTLGKKNLQGERLCPTFQNQTGKKERIRTLRQIWKCGARGP